MKQRTRRRVLAGMVALAVLAGACGPGQDLETGTSTQSTVETTADSTAKAAAEVQPDLQNGVLASWTAKMPRYDEEPSIPPSGDLSITKCSWHGPGRWSAELEWQADPAPTPEQPVELPLLLGLGADPERSNLESLLLNDEPPPEFAGGIARLIGNGSFTVPISGSESGFPGIYEGWWGFYPRSELVPSSRCGVVVLGPEANDPDLEAGVGVVLDPQPLAIATGRSGDIDNSGETVDSLALQVPLTPDWGEHPMAALALLAATDGVPVDQLFFNSAQPVEWIDVKHHAPCIVVTTGQGVGAVRQSRDCESLSLPAAAGPGPDFDLTEAMSIENPDIGMWAVEAVGPDEFIGSIQGFAFDGAVDPSVADRLDLEVAEFVGLVEGGPNAPEQTQPPNASDQTQLPDGWFMLGSYELMGGAGHWRSEQVEVLFDSTNDGCCLDYEVEVDGFNGGATGIACRDWAISLHDDGERGFVVAIVTGEQTVQFIVDAEPMGVPLQSIADEASTIRAGAIDAPFDFSAEVDWLSRVQVLEPDGSRSECVQN